MQTKQLTEYDIDCITVMMVEAVHIAERCIQMTELYYAEQLRKFALMQLCVIYCCSIVELWLIRPCPLLVTIQNWKLMKPLLKRLPYCMI